MASWEPLRRRREGGNEVLYPGVPPWLHPSLKVWAEERLRRQGRVDPERLREMVRVLTWDVEQGAGLWTEFQVRSADPDELLDIIHFLLGQEALTDPATRRPPRPVLDIAIYLTQAGSKWAVGEVNDDGQGRRWGLMERLPAEVDQAVDAVASVTDRGGEHLRSARAHLYGRGPNPTEAYRDAVRAVEAAAKPVVSPKDATATLGKIKGVLRDASDGKFRFAIKGREESDPRDTVVAMLGLLYAGQHDRHGNAEAPPSVSHEEAEAAFHLAVTLVHWFRSGAISQGSP